MSEWSLAAPRCWQRAGAARAPGQEGGRRPAGGRAPRQPHQAGTGGSRKTIRTGAVGGCIGTADGLRSSRAVRGRRGTADGLGLSCQSESGHQPDNRVEIRAAIGGSCGQRVNLGSPRRPGGRRSAHHRGEVRGRVRSENLAKYWRRGWDSHSVGSFRICNLQKPHCHGCHNCQDCRRALHLIAPGNDAWADELLVQGRPASFMAGRRTIASGSKCACMCIHRRGAVLKNGDSRTAVSAARPRFPQSAVGRFRVQSKSK